MSELLTEAWCAATTERLDGLEPGPGGSGVVDWMVSGGPDGKVRVRWTVAEGRPLSVAPVDDPGDGESDVEVPVRVDDVDAMIHGSLDPAVAFMRGDLKPDGQAAAWFALLSALGRDDVRSALDPG